MNRDPSQRQAGKGEQLPEHRVGDRLPILWVTRLFEPQIAIGERSRCG